MRMIHHIALRTSQVDVLVEFYCQWFKLQVERDERPRAIWLRRKGKTILMIEAKEPGEPDPNPAGKDLIAFQVKPSQREKLEAKLRAADLLEDKSDDTLYFRDPDGRRVGASSYDFDGD